MNANVINLLYTVFLGQMLWKKWTKAELLRLGIANVVYSMIIA